ncbi:hypothetical protein M569_17040, partial [Genlisea aurea]
SPKTHIPAGVSKHPAAILLQLCSSMTELHQFLPLVIKSGLYDELHLQTKLVSLFCKLGSLNDAVKVFEPVEVKIDPLYHTILKGYVQQSDLNSALNFFCRMKHDGIDQVIYNYIYLLRACADNFDVERGKEIHGQLTVNGFADDLCTKTNLMNFYAKCGEIHNAYKVFERMPEKDLVSWNTVIAGFAQNGMSRKAMELFLVMQEEGHSPNLVTLVSIIPIVAFTRNLRLGRSIHAYSLRHALESHVNVATSLLDMYAKCGMIEAARLMFDEISSRSVVSWNSMIDGYAQCGYSEEALDLFRKMRDEGVEPTDVTFMGVLRACGDLCDIELGRLVHDLVVQSGLDSDSSVMNSLISMYCKCRRVDIAAELFGKLKEKTLVSWNTMILGHAQNGSAVEALRLFRRMQVKPDSFTFVAVITAVAESSVSMLAKWIHGLSVRAMLDRNIFVRTALIDMYAKCGSVRAARELFDATGERRGITWNAMIDAYGTHGLGREAAELFEEMCRGKLPPDSVTFLSVISACSHSGLVDEGLHYFNTMTEVYALEPSMDHYGAVVDLLGRAGKLEEAWDFIRKIPEEPGLNVYGAMLGACKIHKNVEFGEMAAGKLFALKPDNGGYHVLLSNIYATGSTWEKAGEIRKLMNDEGIDKIPGWSSVSMRNEVHTFYSGSTEHPKFETIYAHLEGLTRRIEAAGYVPSDTSSSTHSEKLAMSFALVSSTGAGEAIQVRKNLRVCWDCHEATKYISMVTGREIVVRDARRFHHFKDGVCSCGDYW